MGAPRTGRDGPTPALSSRLSVSSPSVANGRIAVVDGASFVLPYDLQLVCALARAGAPVSFFGSETRYNGHLLERMRTQAGAELHTARVSRSVAPRWVGVPAYLGLLWRLWRQRRRYTIVNLQFAPAGWLELPLWWLLRRQLVLTVHDPVPHDHAARRHGPTGALASWARHVVFASPFARNEFLRRYGTRHAAKCVVMPHGLLPLDASEAPHPPQALHQPQALVFWGNVDAYKGVDLFEALAADPRLRRRGLRLEVHGRWTPALRPLAARLTEAGVEVHDRFLDDDALRALMARPVLFLLPYRRASQSGALYALLHQGCTMLCSDVGDLGDFMRRHGLPELLLSERSAQAVLDAIDRLAAASADVQRKLRLAQQSCDWDEALRAVAAVYGLGSRSG